MTPGDTPNDGGERKHTMRKFEPKNKSKKTQKKEAKERDQAEDEYQRMRTMQKGPKRSITEKDMEEIDCSVKVDDAQNEKDQADKIAQMKKEFLDGADDDLGKLGFVDSDEEVDLSGFRSLKQLEKEEMDTQPEE